MSNHTKILVVDDEEANRITMEALLSSDHYEVHLASNGVEACMLAPLVVPDLILLDVMMPDVDGFEVCRRLRADRVLATVPIIMLTALNDSQSRIAGIEAGADDFLTKPCGIQELRARVRCITRLNRFRVIAEQRTRFERLFASTPCAITIVAPDGCITAANDLATSLLSPFSNGPLPGRPLIEGLPPATSGPLSAIVERCRRDANPVGSERIDFATSGDVRHFNVTATRLDERGELLVMLVLHDVTAEVRARAELESVNAGLDGLVRDRTRQLEAANELLHSYTAFVSHDLRSPLSVIRGYLSLLLGNGVPVPDTARAHINEAFVASGMMEDMIANILSMAADDHNARLPVTAIDPRPVLERLAWKLSAWAPKPRPRITVGDLPLVYASAPLIERVFFNLISNAIKFTSQTREPRIEVGTTLTETGLAIHVRDNGVGFDPAHAEKLFKPFSRLPGSEQSEGLGLGLSLVSRFVSAHQGRIWAESRPGEGSTFYVEFKTAAVASVA